MKYIDNKELERVITNDLKNGNKLSEKSNLLIFDLINNILLRNNFRNYDEDTKGEMQLTAFDYIQRYIKNFKPYKYVLHFKKGDIDIIKNSINSNLINVENDTITVYNENEYKDIKKIVSQYNLDVKETKTKNRLYSYLTQIIFNAFKYVINKNRQHFMYKTGSSQHSGMSIVTREKDYKDSDIYEHEMELSSDSSNNNITIKKDFKQKDNIIYDRDEIIDFILSNSDDIDDVINISYKTINEGGEREGKKIYRDKTLTYILLRNIAE